MDIDQIYEVAESRGLIPVEVTRSDKGSVVRLMSREELQVCVDVCVWSV